MISPLQVVEQLFACVEMCEVELDKCESAEVGGREGMHLAQQFPRRQDERFIPECIDGAKYRRASGTDNHAPVGL